MFNRIREYNYIKKIRAAMAKSSMLKYLELNTYKSNATNDLLHDRISEEFYKSIFCGGTFDRHYTEVNIKAIENYKF